MNKTNIPWTDLTWNPITGCTRGCNYCYARKVAERFGSKSTADGGPQVSYDKRPFPFGFDPTMYPDRLDEPLRRKKPATIFLGSMGDVFDPAFPDEFRDRIFMVTLVRPEHTFMLLTKRAEEMRCYFTDPDRASAVFLTQPNLWLGVTVTNQADADERIPLLLDTPAAHRFVSVEPMLGPVDFGDWRTSALWEIYSLGDTDYPALNLVAVGGKTPGKPLHEQDEAPMPCGGICCGDAGCEATPNIEASEWVCDCACHFGSGTPADWLRSLRDQCLAAGVPFHYKAGSTNPALDGVVYDAGVT